MKLSLYPFYVEILKEREDPSDELFEQDIKKAEEQIREYKRLKTKAKLAKMTIKATKATMKSLSYEEKIDELS